MAARNLPWTLVAENLVFPESLRWQNGDLWFADMYDGRLFRAHDGELPQLIHNQQGQIGGIGWMPDGRLLFVDKLTRRVMALHKDGPQLHADLGGYGHSRCNDMLVMPDGGAFVGEYGYDLHGGGRYQTGNLYYIDPDGNPRIAAEDLAFPNGMAIGGDGKTLILAESAAGWLSAFDFDGKAGLGPRRTFSKFDLGRPDGISEGSDGEIWAALVLATKVAHCGAAGQLLGAIELDVEPFDVVVGGPESKTVFIAVCGMSSEEFSSANQPRKGAVIAVDISGLAKANI